MIIVHTYIHYSLHNLVLAYCNYDASITKQTMYVKGIFNDWKRNTNTDIILVLHINVELKQNYYYLVTIQTFEYNFECLL